MKNRDHRLVELLNTQWHTLDKEESHKMFTLSYSTREGSTDAPTKDKNTKRPDPKAM